MKLKPLLLRVQQIAEVNGISRPYLVGGVPRDKMAGVINNFNDLDITNGDNSIKELAIKVYHELDGSRFKEFNDGHSQVTLNNIKLDFSSNFKSPGIRRLLQSLGLKNPTNLQEECFSRDFTINTLLMSLDLKNIKDPTGFAIPDIKNKVIKTCLAPGITFKDKPNRVVRAVYLSAKLNFNIDNEIVEYVKNNKYILKDERNSYSRNKLQKALEYNYERTIKALNVMGLWDVFNLPKDLLAAKRQA